MQAQTAYREVWFHDDNTRRLPHRHNDEFLANARAYFVNGDLLQASGAAARMVKAVAETRGWRHNSHGDLYRVVGWLANELEDEQLRSLFISANSLHENFYEGPMPEEFIADALDDLEEITRRLKAVIS